MEPKLTNSPCKDKIDSKCFKEYKFKEALLVTTKLLLL